MTRLRILLGALALLAARAPAADDPPPPIGGLEYLGRSVLPRGLQVDGTRVGGFSGLAYDAAANRLWAISDDRGERGPVRLYRIRLELGSDGGGKVVPRVAVEKALSLREADGRPVLPATVDAEGLAVVPGGFVVATEAIEDRIPARLVEVGPDGRIRRDLLLPDRLLASPGCGVPDNLGFESLTVSPDGRTVLAGLENALAQDGPAAAFGVGSATRLLKVGRRPGARLEEFVYPVDPVSIPSPRPSGQELNGLSEVLWLDDHRFLALERQYVEAVGNSIRLYEVSIEGSTDVSGLESLEGASYAPAVKLRLRDIGDFGVPPENFEGMSFGPRLPDGRDTLILVSDDNFNPRQEATTFLVFAVDRRLREGGAGTVGRHDRRHAPRRGGV